MTTYLYVTNLNINNDDLLHAIARHHNFCKCFSHVDMLKARFNITAYVSDRESRADFINMLQDLAENGFKSEISAEV